MTAMESGRVEQLKGRMQSLAFGEAMLAAATDYKREQESAQRNSGTAGPADVDLQELLDDPELERLHRERIAEMQQEAERRAVLKRKGHGTYDEVAEGEFLEATTKGELVVAHFFHRDFQRCRALDGHLAQLAPKYFMTRFIKLSAPDSPFFTLKLGVKVLPCVIMFRNGVAFDRIVGFEGLGGSETISTAALERRLLKAGVVEAPKPTRDQIEAMQQQKQRRVTKSMLNDSDEDSDFG